VSLTGLAFVTGGSGFLGRRFLQIMRRQHPGLRFRALVHRAPLPVMDAVEPVHGGLDDRDGLARLLGGVDTVIHFAAITHAARPEDYAAVNSRGTENLVQAATRVGVRRFIHISTRAIHAECGAYGASKRCAEEAVRSHPIAHVILRFAEVYGAGSREGIDALLGLVRRWPLVPYPAGPVSLAPLLIDDALSAVVRATERPDLVNVTYTIAGPHSVTLPELIRTASTVFGGRRWSVPVPLMAITLMSRLALALGRPVVKLDQIPRLTCPKESVIDDARRDLGFEPAGLQDGLRRIVQERGVPV
jgi:NADH dehydrogenase